MAKIQDGKGQAQPSQGDNQIMLPLFDESGFDRSGFAHRLKHAGNENIFIGTSSWKYPGWLDQIYSRERYSTRGRFSKKRFDAECITEYAETFSTVCGDFAFYQFPQPQFWAHLFGQVPKEFRFSFKVPEQITRMEFPNLPRYGSQAGTTNPFFLNAEILKDEFLTPLEKYGSQVAVIIFEFGALPLAVARQPAQFLDGLDGFLAKLPDTFRIGFEIRNPELLTTAYFETLRSHRVAHVYNAWSRMPDLPEQIAISDSLTADFVVCRALLRHGRPYEKAVQMFEPYKEVQEPYPPAREGLRQLISTARSRKMSAFVYVNNRLEGNAPGTIEAVL